MGNVTRLTIILAATALLGAMGGYALWRAYDAGRDAERKAALDRSIEIIQERARTNEKVGRLDDASLCRELGGVFEDGECH